MALLYENKIEVSNPTVQFTPTVERFKTDNYSVRASRGFNAQDEVWTVVWVNLTKSEANNLRAALKAASVEVLWWTSPLESSDKPYTCTNYAANPLVGDFDRWTLTATLQREYDPV